MANDLHSHNPWTKKWGHFTRPWTNELDGYETLDPPKG